MLKGPLASLERHDRPACEGRSGSERSTEPGSSAKTVASQPVVGYRIRPRTAKKEILVWWRAALIMRNVCSTALLEPVVPAASSTVWSNRWAMSFRPSSRCRKPIRSRSQSSFRASTHRSSRWFCRTSTRPSWRFGVPRAIQPRVVRRCSGGRGDVQPPGVKRWARVAAGSGRGGYRAGRSDSEPDVRFRRSPSHRYDRNEGDSFAC